MRENMKKGKRVQFQQEYLDDQLWVLTFNGGLGRTNTYRKTIDKNEERRDKFKMFIKSTMSDLFLSSYQRKAVSTDIHIKNLWNIKRKIDKRFNEILADKEINFGVVQKLFNLYIKLKWSVGLCPEPPHCPFDSIVIGKLGMKPPPMWTKFNDKKTYTNLVEHADKVSGKKSIAQWELEIFQKNRPISNSKRK